MDIATLIGVFCGFMCITVSIITGGESGVFFHIPSMMITVGGMISATLMHFSLGQVMGIFSIIKKTLFYKLPADQNLIQQMVNYAAINRRDGVLALEQQLASIHDPFMVKALQMVIDGQKEDAIDEYLATEIEYLQERHATGKKILEFMGASAPAFGMIGTLIGLVQMLGNLKDPSEIGGGMATALITTFYGALLSNLVFIPLAGKLGIRSKKESITREMIVQGVMGLVKGESPTGVRERMQAFISNKHREDLRPKI